MFYVQVIFLLHGVHIVAYMFNVYQYFVSTCLTVLNNQIYKCPMFRLNSWLYVQEDPIPSKVDRNSSLRDFSRNKWNAQDWQTLWLLTLSCRIVCVYWQLNFWNLNSLKTLYRYWFSFTYFYDTKRKQMFWKFLLFLHAFFELNSNLLLLF